MKDAKKPRRNQNKKRPGSIRNYCLMLLCGAIVISGFFFAARQHFVSMDYGMKNSKLRRQLDELEAEKRRLLFNREVSVSPMELKRSAKKAGLLDTATVAQAAPQLASAPSPVKPQIAVPVKASSNQAERRGTIVKTASVYPVNQPITAGYTKVQKAERASRRTVQAE
jgi:hypothetical protein